VFSRLRKDSGFSAVELLVVCAIVGAMAAIGVPLSTGMIDDIKIRGDAQGLSAAVAQTKLTASAQFTHARLFVNTATSTYRIQTWNKTGTPGWVAASDPMLLSNRSRFGFGTVVAPPPNTTATLAQAPLCLDDQGESIPSTACVIFNSRGISVLAAGPPATTQGLYLFGPSGTYGIVLGGTGKLEVWRTTQTGASSWRQQ
jgi:prepilin-type N-terminal cleavage/methylation domain-containing protein